MKLSLSKKFYTAFALMSFMSAGAFAHDKYTYKGAMKDIPHSVIHFDAGSSVLSEAARTSLRNLISDARSNGRIRDVTVAAWSDQAFPRGKEDLSKADRD